MWHHLKPGCFYPVKIFTRKQETGQITKCFLPQEFRRQNERYEVKRLLSPMVARMKIE